MQQKIDAANIAGTKGLIQEPASVKHVEESDLREEPDVFVERAHGWQKAKYVGIYKSEASGITKYMVAFEDVSVNPDGPTHKKIDDISLIFKQID